jgi:hypothetical protein
MCALLGTGCGPPMLHMYPGRRCCICTPDPNSAMTRVEAARSARGSATRPNVTLHPRRPSRTLGRRSRPPAGLIARMAGTSARAIDRVRGRCGPSPASPPGRRAAVPLARAASRERQRAEAAQISQTSSGFYKLALS